jgi:hypothetical protein
MDAMILYLKDNAEGTVDVNLEAIGNPTNSLRVALAIANNMKELDWAVFNAYNEFTAPPPSNRIQ